MKTATTITEVPQSVSVIPRETFEQKSPSKVDKPLRNITGVQIQLYGHDSDTNWFYIRGFNASDTGAFLDRLSLFSYGFGSFYIDPFLLERTKVLKGPSSMLYGAIEPRRHRQLCLETSRRHRWHKAQVWRRPRGPHLDQRRAVRRDR
ncbi:TonB-dependent receptor plug domain-containing protein [Sulfitobacter sp. BDSS02]|nr:TonB-dependent receptor plug domain-containing protein [Sulfitobacter sp. BDSS02]MBR9850631.1 TonB-dependent receptor plug domain-containing protein [Paracoccaceae bacterium]